MNLTSKYAGTDFRVIIAGSRSFKDYEMLKRKMDELLSLKIKAGYNIIIVSGTASGADRLGERYAKERGYKIEQYPANWEKYGKAAGYRRNVEMATNSDALAAFWDGESKGTKHMINIADTHHLNVRVFRY